MKTLSYIVVFLFLAVLLTLLAIQDPGYVLLVRKPWHIEMSLTVFVLAALLFYFLLHWLVRFLRAVWQTPGGVVAWRQYKALQRAQRAMVEGYLEVLTGDYQKAEQRLLANTRNSPTPLMNFLAAAYAAQQRDDWQQRDYYLEQAQNLDQSNDFVLGLAQARLQYEAGQYELAWARCEQLRLQHAKHPQVLKLLTRLRQQFGYWREILDSLPLLRKKSVFDDASNNELERRAVLGVLEQTAENDQTGLHKSWQRLSNAQKQRSDIVAGYAQLLIDLKHDDEAAVLLVAAIKKHWSEPLVYLYGICECSRPLEQLRRAESWTQGQQENATLLLTLGRLAIRNQLWGKARSYLETCIDSGEYDEAYAIFGQLLEDLGETERAMEIYRRGVQLKEGSHGVATNTGLSAPAEVIPLKTKTLPDAEIPDNVPVLGVNPGTAK